MMPFISFMWMKPGYFFSMSCSSLSAVWETLCSWSVDMQIRYGTIWGEKIVVYSFHHQFKDGN